MFRDRAEAGKRLAEVVIKYGATSPIVLAIPRGGVVVGAEVSARLGCPMDVIICSKLGAPLEPELAVGAICESSRNIYLNQGLINGLGIDEKYIEGLARAKAREMEERRRLYRSGRELMQVSGKDVFVVDDGMATGATVMAAVRYLEKKSPRSIVVAVPVAQRSVVREVAQSVDEVLTVESYDDMIAISQYYERFEQVSDEEVLSILSSGKTLTGL
ncbi:phosphoribosyltransferase [Thermogymnomonas acidicola]|uniref:Phosphoribosyltransferase n=1 Tax=Thermogymnomonas acidicola TaxID=399579 RepID=A0AA37BPW7_9ARCH|nr:phosphoribosyltransferase family protein [Thermogymnomonas acidicola]GGM67244.1 phosphoribosyltransferase [Thermogymnomonas acidicola]